MPGMGERAYAYAKACGIIGKSFIGKRISRLADVSRLSELDRLVFPQSVRDLPERELLVDIEERVIQRAVNQITAIVDSFSKPPELLIRLIRTYEYEDLKNVLGALARGETKAPGFTDIGRFRTVTFEAYPDLESMLAKTEFEFLLTEALQQDQNEQPVHKKDAGSIIIQTKLDHHYYASLWKALLRLRKNDRIAIERILSEEISLRNAVWALRLRTYYGMSGHGILEKLISIKTKKSLTAAAEASLSMALDHRAEWAGWKWVQFLNPENHQDTWKADPRYFQNAASRYLYSLARFSFRRRPFSADSIFCFIKLKQFEEDILTSAAEGLGMGMSSQDIFTLLEVGS
ncbi:MAG: V-type ATPase subunit [Treponema sp.]|jgi:vacuolar-type H+-ATPase subunit C/Vma6|nr:V-type ATPase subunit [Treponema sp.]